MRLLAGLLVAALLAGCTSTAPGEGATPAPSRPATSTPTAAAVPGGTFRYAVGEPTAITSPLASTGDDRAVVDALYDSLTAWDPAGHAIPAAAVTWEDDGTATRWTFRLRPGATFHDGRPVTAEDFRRGWARAAVGPMGHLLADVVGHDAVARGSAAELSGVAAPDDLRLEIQLTRPRGDLPVVLGHPALGPLHPADAVDGMVLQPIGNGPFRLTEPWARGEFIRAARWDGWMNGSRSPEGIAEVVFRIGDLDINFLAFTQGRREMAAVPPDALELAAAEYPPTGGDRSGPGLILGDRPEVYLLAIDGSVPPYDDQRVREAVSLALDRVAIAAGSGGGILTPSTSLLPPGLPGARTGTCELCTYNPSGARSRMEDAGVDVLSWAFNAGGGHEVIRNALRSALSGIGVSLVSNGRGPAPPLPEYQARLAEGGVGLFRLPLSADVPSALSVLHPLLHPDQTPQLGGQNFLRYDNPSVTALLDRAATTVDDGVRERLLRRVEDIALNDDHVVVPVVSYRHAVVAAETVSGLRYGPFGLVNLTELSLQEG